jgi:hypothetical protein
MTLRFLLCCSQAIQGSGSCCRPNSGANEGGTGTNSQMAFQRQGNPE